MVRDTRDARRAAARVDKPVLKQTEHLHLGQVRVRAHGGKGGNGVIAWSPGSRSDHLHPAGGDGGHGGSVLLRATAAKGSLRGIMAVQLAEAGQPGARFGRQGARGQDKVINVPLGTIVRQLPAPPSAAVAEALAEAEEQEADETDPDAREASSSGRHAQGVQSYGAQHGSTRPMPVRWDSNEAAAPMGAPLRDDGYGDDLYDAQEEDSVAEARGGEDSSGEYSSGDDSCDDSEREGCRGGSISWGNRGGITSGDNSSGRPVWMDDAVSSSARHQRRVDRDAWLEDLPIVAELELEGQEVVVAFGGRGGRGSAALPSPQGRKPVGQRELGEAGEVAHLLLEARLLADIGFVGMPNAGKSTLLSALTSARAKVADYPFTTLGPQIGTLQFSDGHRLALVDVPGLLAGAHIGAGRGSSFLRLVEHVRCVALVVDLSGGQPGALLRETPVEQLQVLQAELHLYRDGTSRLSSVPTMVVANKLDVARDAAGQLALLKAATPLPLVPVSAGQQVGLDRLRLALRILAGADPK